MRHLSGKRRGNSDKVEVLGTVVNGHLFAPAQIVVIGEALVAELLHPEAAVHQHACVEEAQKRNLPEAARKGLIAR